MPPPRITAQQVPRLLRAFRERTATASPMSAREWAQVPVEIRQEAFWSAKLEHARHVADLKRASIQALSGARVRVGSLRRGADLTGEKANETVLMSTGQIVKEMRAAAKERSLMPTGPREIEDIASGSRIRLIIDMAEKTTYNRAKWEDGLDPDVLAAWPAQELVRVEPRKEPRDWDARWREAGEAVAWEGAVKDGPMIALKSSPIWVELSEFGMPYPPFDYGSGMGTRDVTYADAVQWGLLNDGDSIEVKEPEMERRGSLAGLDDTEREWAVNLFKEALGDGVEVIGDEVIWRRG